jgi:uncharacterized protein YjiS (DUF1127 family)
MSKTTLDIATVRSHRGFCWGQVQRGFAAWRLGGSSGIETTDLSDRILRDIGVSRRQADFSAYKPFWMA